MPSLKTDRNALFFCGLSLFCLAGLGAAQPGNERQGSEEPLPLGALRRLACAKRRSLHRTLERLHQESGPGHRYDA